MSAMPLYRHGGHVKPQYAADSAGRSTDAERPDGRASGIVKRFHRNEKASSQVAAYGWIKAAYENAIEYTGIPQNVRGMVLVAATFGACIGIGFGQMSFHSMLGEFGDDNFLAGVMLLSSIVFVAFGVLFLLWGIRFELFRPEDEPTIFDRKHRKVYRLFRETQPGLKCLLKPWPMRACEYDWDLIDAEHNARVVTTGSTVTRYSSLTFIVRKSATDPTIIDSFNIGNGMTLIGDDSVSAVWEHIRRFMEEDGPQLPPGEPLAPADLPQTLWQSLGAVGPFGPKYFEWWRDSPFITAFFHLVLPFFLPLFTFVGIGNWLSNRTSFKVHWPAEVAEAIGPALVA